MPHADSPLRKDAARNRDRLLAAAAELFALHGLDVTLNDIAHHAGVGVGTAYRRFSNKEELIDALFEQRLQDVAAVAHEALAEADAWPGLVTFLERSLEMQFGDRGLNQIMTRSTLDRARLTDAKDRIAPLIEQLVLKAQQARVVRPDLDPTDIIFMQLALSAIMDRSRTLAPELYRRYLALFLDGIRPHRRAHTPLPVEALSAERTHLVMTAQHKTRTSS
jgi:AcrR family transcriptional regulator